MIPPGICVSVCALSMLYSITTGCFIVFENCSLSLPVFCLPVFFLSLITLAVHILLVLMGTAILFDNYRCIYRRRHFILLCLVLWFTSLGYSLFFRLGIKFFPFLFNILALGLMAVFWFEARRRFTLLILPIMGYLMYLLILIIFCL